MLSISQLSAFYGHIEALRSVDIYVETGKITTLVGANGAGKSTLLRVLSGILPARYGRITYMGKDVTNHPPHRLVRLGICHVPEGRQVFGSMTVRENLELGAYVRHRREPRKELEKDLEFVFDLFPALKERERQEAGTLSGGEQQMLAICRGLMADPKVLLLDEPSLGLAPILVNEIFQLILKIHSMGVTVLLVEQNARKALSICDYAYVLETGSVTFQGTGEELLCNEQISEAYLGKTVEKEAAG